MKPLPTKEIVVLVHGLWMTGIDMSLLHMRLRRRGFRVVQFSYPTIRRDIARNAASLQEFVHALDADTVHFVGHSMGGLVILRMLQDFPASDSGRVVLLGTPYSGSYVACRLAKFGFWRGLFGHSLEQCLLGNGPQWMGGGELGVIAGTLPLGGGWIIGGLPPPSDGVVTVAETCIPGMTAHLALRVSHTGMLFAPKVAREVAAFLQTGRFIQ